MSSTSSGLTTLLRKKASSTSSSSSASLPMLFPQHTPRSVRLLHPRWSTRTRRQQQPKRLAWAEEQADEGPFTVIKQAKICEIYREKSRCEDHYPRAQDDEFKQPQSP